MDASAIRSRRAFRTVLPAAAIALVFLVSAISARVAAAQRYADGPAFTRCQQELQSRMSREVGGRQPDAYVDERRIQVDQLSNAETRVRGNGRYMRDSNDSGRDFSFDCAFNSRNNSARATYNWGSGSGSGGGQYLEPGYAQRQRGESVPEGRVFFSGGIVSRSSAKCVDVEGRSSRNAANVQQWTCSGGSNQLWNILDLGRGQYSITSRGSGKALTVSGGGRDGAQVEQSRWNGADNQRWRLEKGRNDTYRIVSVSHDSCLDVEGAKREDGAKIQLWGCSGGANQAWLLRK